MNPGVAAPAAGFPYDDGAESLMTDELLPNDLALVDPRQPGQDAVGTDGALIPSAAIPNGIWIVDDYSYAPDEQAVLPAVRRWRRPTLPLWL